MSAIKKVHKDGFVVINTKIGEITIALPDSEKSKDGFTLSIEEEDGIAEIIELNFKECQP